MGIYWCGFTITSILWTLNCTVGAPGDVPLRCYLGINNDNDLFHYLCLFTHYVDMISVLCPFA